MKVLIRCEECGRTTTYGLRICKGCREKNLRHFKSTVRKEKGVFAGRPLNPKPSDRVGSTASGDTLRNMRPRP